MHRRLDEAVARAVDCLCLPRQAGTPPRAYARLSLRGKIIKIDKQLPLLIYNISLSQNQEGHQYDTSDSWTKYLQAIFRQHKDVSISTNAMRASYVTHLLSGEAPLSDHILTQAARAMRHSRKEQARTYDCRTSSDKVAHAVQLSSKEAASALGDRVSDVEPSTSGGNSKKKKLLPCVGDIVALVEERSTRDEPVVMLGKVLRLYQDSQEVLLAHLRLVEKSRKSSPTYKLTIGKDAWVESYDSLVFPVDVAYDSARGVYSLRTPSTEIHDHVHNGQDSDSD